MEEENQKISIKVPQYLSVKIVRWSVVSVVANSFLILVAIIVTLFVYGRSIVKLADVVDKIPELTLNVEFLSKDTTVLRDYIEKHIPLANALQAKIDTLQAKIDKLEMDIKKLTIIEFTPEKPSWYSVGTPFSSPEGDFAVELDSVSGAGDTANCQFKFKDASKGNRISVWSNKPSAVPQNGYVYSFQVCNVNSAPASVSDRTCSLIFSRVRISDPTSSIHPC